MLYVVSTPIGNLKDISLRALDVLRAVDLIACEDTRHSLKFLSAYDIKKPLISYHKFNEKEESEKLIDMLRDGKEIALISDAGTPLISDPGNVLTKLLVENSIPFTVIPGACAFVPAMILSGLDTSRFCFLGFLPEKQSHREEFLNKYKDLDLTLIFYSAPHDVEKDVKTIYSVFGERRAVAVREITKMFEEAIPFNLKDGLPKEPRGEFVIVVEGANEQDKFSNLSIEDHLNTYINAGMDKKEALKKVAKERGIPKSELYKLTLNDR
jgi:16S rRNA (cytidine1402-2'-O)-methyltransferase